MKLYPKKIQAAILVKQNSSLVIDEIALPQKLLKGQVLVKMFYSGICGSQLGEISGVKGKDKYLPHLLGHEGVGEVIDYGYKVETVTNAVSSRFDINNKVGLERVHDVGSKLTTVELILFYLQKQAVGNRFKKLIQLVK